jgi:hypothetical protein
MNYYKSYIFLIIAIKIGFLLMALTHVYLKISGKEGSELDKNIVYWKERIEFIFIILMSILLIYLFNPRYNNLIKIDNETKILLYLFGIILLITADWKVFLKESKWFEYLQQIVGKE